MNLEPLNEDTFWVRINRRTGYISERGPGGECWGWKGAHVEGRAVVTIDKRLLKVYRVTYTLLCGEIPPKATLDHLCTTPWCVNPFHLEPVPASENNRRAAALITHCPQGHEYAGRNLILNGSNRRCRTCTNQRALERYHRKKAKP